MARTVSITVNGTRQRREVEPRLLLVHFLRDTLGLTGTHIGCDGARERDFHLCSTRDSAVSIARRVLICARCAR